MRRLVEKFSSGNHASDGDDGSDVLVSPDSDGVLFEVGAEKCKLSREEVRDLLDSLEAALTRRHEFVHTVGVHREDGSYVVERRGANSSGHRKVFDSFEALGRFYDRLPDEFAADDLSCKGVTGGRRHMLVWHFAEHPGFECTLEARQPLTVKKRETAAGEDAEATTLADMGVLPAD